MKKATLLLFLFLSACANRALKYEHVDELKKIDEFDQQVKIVTTEDSKAVIDRPKTTVPQMSSPTAAEDEKKASDKKQKKEKKKSDFKQGKRQPEIENDQGFVGRRPIVDPFRVGERVEHVVSYLGVKAGRISFETKPFAQVNGKSSYQFQISAWTTSVFASAYSLEDKAITLVDFESLVPTVFSVHIKETGQLKEARSLYDHKKGLITYWEKKVTSAEGEKEKKLQWEAPPYSQNAFSAVFYMRAFQWKVGDERQFRVADDEHNLILKLKAVRAEKISTAIGDFNTIVLKPTVDNKGVPKPIGDILFWITDDDRKLLVKIEAKIAIGTLVSEVADLDLGRTSN